MSTEGGLLDLLTIKITLPKKLILELGMPLFKKPLNKIQISLFKYQILLQNIEKPFPICMYLWLQVIINGAVLAIVDQSVLKVEDDFRKIEVINVDVDRRLYFQTTAVTQRAVENDLLDANLLVRLCELRHPVVDCSALETAYPEPIPPTPEVIEVPVVAQAEAHNPNVSPYDSSYRPHRSNLNSIPRNRGNYNRAPYKYRN